MFTIMFVLREELRELEAKYLKNTAFKTIFLHKFGKNESICGGREFFFRMKDVSSSPKPSPAVV